MRTKKAIKKLKVPDNANEQEIFRKTETKGTCYALVQGIALGDREC